jgi:hypothetical protein
MMNANGKIMTVSKKSHPDLFWALCGAGNGSFGIVLEFTFKMHKIDKASTLKLTWDWDSTTVKSVFHAWVESLPQNISSQLQLKYQNKSLSLIVTGLKIGAEPFTEWKSAFCPLCPSVECSSGSYLESAYEWADRAPYPFFKSKSEILFEPLSDEPIDTAIAFFERLKCHKEGYYAFFELEAMGGAITQGDSAFFPRDAFAWWYQVMYWDQEQMGHHAITSLNHFKADIAPFVSPYCYANIVDYDIEDYMHAYYGDHKDRLIDIKQKYDPANLFNWRQSIPPCR